MKRPLRWLNDAAARTPLRVKLVATVLALAAVGLSLAGVAATTSLHSYLLGRVDDQLRTASRSIADGYGFHNGGPGGPGGFGSTSGRGPRFPSEFYAVPFTAAGVPDGTPQDALLSGQSPPKLPKLTSADINALNGHPFTVSARSGNGEWRVVARPIPAATGGVAIATSLSDLDHTVDHLILLEVLIGGVVLLLMGGGGYFLIKRSLRPLVGVENTAAAIAAGDLSQRVPAGHPRTEVGRLSGALNGMLAQIEDAFAQERSSKRQARASEDRMRQFVADASHELRTPLTSIRGFAELHRMGATTDEADVQRLMRRVEDEASRMGVLVEDLLLLARLDQQRPLERAPVDLLEIASDVVHDARVVAPERSIDLQVHTVTPPVVLGDESRLRQVLHNLMANAITHTPDGTPVTVILSTYDGANPRAVLDVADAGPGLSEEQTGRVFERFYRADTSRSRDAGGTGLGLSIVAGIVAAHGGQVSIESSVGEGTIFRVELPLASNQPADPPGGAEQPPAETLTNGATTQPSALEDVAAWRQPAAVDQPAT
jgi:two-component system, OmpR family, sensor kinase